MGSGDFLGPELQTPKIKKKVMKNSKTNADMIFFVDAGIFPALDPQKTTSRLGFIHQANMTFRNPVQTRKSRFSESGRAMPCPSFPCFLLDFLVFLGKDFHLFEWLPFFSKDFGCSIGITNPRSLGSFPCVFKVKITSRNKSNHKNGHF